MENDPATLHHLHKATLHHPHTVIISWLCKILQILWPEKTRIEDLWGREREREREGGGGGASDEVNSGLSDHVRTVPLDWPHPQEACQQHHQAVTWNPQGKTKRGRPRVGSATPSGNLPATSPGRL